MRVYTESTTFERLPAGALFLFQESTEVCQKVTERAYRPILDKGEHGDEKPVYLTGLPVARIIVKPAPRIVPYRAAPAGARFYWADESGAQVWYKWTNDAFAPIPPPNGQATPAPGESARGCLVQIPAAHPYDTRAREVVLLDS